MSKSFICIKKGLVVNKKFIISIDLTTTTFTGKSYYVISVANLGVDGSPTYYTVYQNVESDNFDKITKFLEENTD